MPWLWWRPAAAAPLSPLTWELPYAAGAAVKTNKKKETQNGPPGLHPFQGSSGGSISWLFPVVEVSVFLGPKPHIIPTSAPFLTSASLSLTLLPPFAKAPYDDTGTSV